MFVIAQSVLLAAALLAPDCPMATEASLCQATNDIKGMRGPRTGPSACEPTDGRTPETDAIPTGAVLTSIIGWARLRGLLGGTGTMAPPSARYLYGGRPCA
jgi:hypothetical protein